MPNDDREQQFERALTRHLRNASPDSACPDAETLAAYHERTLSLEEMAQWKEHIAGCARCQESLALVEQTENLHAEESEHQNVPVPMEAAAGASLNLRGAASKARREDGALPATPKAIAAVPAATASFRPPWRWIVPVGALAAGVIVWVGVREIRLQHQASEAAIQVAENRKETVEIPSSRNDLGDAAKNTAPPARVLEEENRARKTAPALNSPLASSLTRTPSHEPAPPPPAFDEMVKQQKDLKSAELPKAAAAMPTPSPKRDAARSSADSATPTLPPAPKEGYGQGMGAGVAGAIAGDNSTKEKKSEPVGVMTQTVVVDSAAPTVDTSGSNAITVPSAPSTQLQIQSRNVYSLLQLSAADRRYILAPGEKVAWRVDNSGKIERSTDHGKSWKLQKSGVTADLTSGSATSDKVCWIIGKAGTLLRTTDGGKHWTTVTSPIAEDLGGIHATDPEHASIWDLPNRNSYETSDGGVTWKRTSNE